MMYLHQTYLNMGSCTRPYKETANMKAKLKNNKKHQLVHAYNISSGELASLHTTLNCADTVKWGTVHM